MQMHAGANEGSQSPSLASPPPGHERPRIDDQHSPVSPAQRKASHRQTNTLSARSCVTCRRRKVKCDKQVPCSNCTKASSECVFPAPGRAPRRPRQTGKVVGEREAELLKRLRRLEGVVEELSGQVELEGLKPSPSSDANSSPPVHKDGDSADGRNVAIDEEAKRKWFGRNFRMGLGPPKTAFSVDGATQAVGKLVLEEGRSRYVASPFWASVSEEVEEIKELLEEQEYESDSDTPIGPSSDVTKPDHQAFIMGYSSSDLSLKKLHPLPSQIPFYWQIFLENVQPLSMLLHPPTMSKTIKEVMSDLESLSPSTEALMFSIYFATVTSMSHEEVQTSLGLDKTNLLKQYRFGVEQALSKASFLNTTEITTMQALTLFLVCVRRHDDTGYMWALTGLALRISQSLGLHRDGAKLGLAPFDTEMRRRLWWLIVLLDIRASEDHGTDVSLMNSSFDTEFPLSVDDDALTPGMTEPPVVKTGVSAMTFCLIRCEISVMMRKVTFSPLGSSSMSNLRALTLKEKENIVTEFKVHMEDTYLQYCENTGPLNWVGSTIARLVSNKMLLMIYHPLTQPGKPSALPQETRDHLFIVSIQIIEFTRSLEDESSIKQWGWMFRTYLQWHAIAYILGELGVRDGSATVDRAWRAMDSLFNQWGEMMSNSGLLWQPMRKLMARARRKRQQNLEKAQSTGLGMKREHNPPPLSTLAEPSFAFGTAQQDSTRGVAAPNKMSMGSTMDPSFTMAADTMIQPQAMGMATGMGESQVSYGQQAGQQPSSWIMDDNELLDMDMSGLDGDVSWHGWDELVRGFQLDAESQSQENDMARGPVMGSMGNWW